MGVARACVAESRFLLKREKDSINVRPLSVRDRRYGPPWNGSKIDDLKIAYFSRVRSLACGHGTVRQASARPASFRAASPFLLLLDECLFRGVQEHPYGVIEPFPFRVAGN